MNNYSIYPKQFAHQPIPVEKNRCFVLMPFDKKYDLLYGSIKKELTDMGLICNRDDEIQGTAPFINKVITEILRSRYVIVILTDFRPNVLYELGIAHTFKDIQNVLLITEHGSQFEQDVHNKASDLSHLTYIEYDSNNMLYLKAQIRDFIENNRYIADFYEILNIKGIIQLVTESDDFSQYVQSLMGSECAIQITEAFADNYVKKDVFQTLAIKMESILLQTLKDGKIDWLSGEIKLYCELLAIGSDYESAEIFCENFLTNLFDRAPAVSENNLITWYTDFCITLAEKKKFLNVVMPWIIAYFKQSKSATIDLNRYRLEKFLLTSPYNEVNDQICNSLRHDDCHIREHMADIIGEKRLVQGEDILCIALLNEENYFTATSIISALGKLGIERDKYTIMEWMNKYFQDIVLTKNFFVFRHIKKALEFLVRSPQSDPVAAEFDQKCGEYIKNYFIY